MIRACALPNEEFSNINVIVIQDCCHKFYKLYEQNFGTKQCTYSVHVLSSHLLQIRGNEPLTFNSAFKFESFYSEMRNNFQPGTSSTLKQILKNTLIKRCVEYHVCQTSMFFKPDKISKNGEDIKQSRECNNLIYIFKNDNFSFFKIISINDDQLVCVRQGVFLAQFNLTPELNWQNVGVFRAGPCGSNQVILHINDVGGKAIRVGKFIITCPANILREK